MQKDVFLSDFKLKQVSIFDLGEFYKHLFRWFENNGYAFYEKLYQDHDEAGGKHIEIFWYTEKPIDAYFKYVIEVNMILLGMNKVEVERGGVKIKTDKGAIEFRITAYLAKDYDNKWSSSQGMRALRKFYDKFMIRDRFERLEGEFAKDFNNLLDEMRSYLALHKS